MELPGPLPSQTVETEPTQGSIDAYRRLSSDAAAGVGVVSTILRGRDYAATVSGFLSVSYDPPTMMVSLYAEARIADAVADAEMWVLSLLASRHRAVANWLASPGTPVEGLLAQVPYRRGPATGAAVVDGALAYFELKTSAVHRAATHLLIVGEVLSMGSDADPGDLMDPLIHFGSAYHRLGA